jgi:hypothetical protein
MDRCNLPNTLHHSIAINRRGASHRELADRALKSPHLMRTSFLAAELSVA